MLDVAGFGDSLASAFDSPLLLWVICEAVFKPGRVDFIEPMGCSSLDVPACSPIESPLSFLEVWTSIAAVSVNQPPIHRPLSTSFSGTSAFYPINSNHDSNIAAAKAPSLRTNRHSEIMAPALLGEEYGILRTSLSSIPLGISETFHRLSSSLKESLIPKAATIMLAAACAYLAHPSWLFIKLFLHL